MGDPAAVLASAGRILGWERGEAARFEEASLARHPPFLPFVLHRDLTWEEVSALELRTPELAGLQVVSAVARHYPLGPALGHLLGYVSAPDESDQRRYPQIRRMPGARVGRAGLEARFEPALQGRPGARQLEVDAAGRRVRELSYERGEAGEDIVASVDAGMQSYVWRRLQSERSAAAAVLDLSSGDTLALCSTPAADPALFDGRMTAELWAGLQSDPLRPLMDKAAAGQYAPGSTFKPVVALAALQAGLSPHETFYCPGWFELGNHRFHCWKKHGHGTVAMEEAIKASCDVYFYRAGLRAGLERIAAVARAFGLGEATGAGLAGEAGGLVPSRAWKERVHGGRWQEGGDGGARHRPREHPRHTPPAGGLGRTDRHRAPAAPAHRPPGPRSALRGQLLLPARPLLRPALRRALRHLELVRKALDVAVNEPGGTAYRRRITGEGMEMAGKTGTSQVRRISRAERDLGVVKNEDLPWRRRDHALFIGYAPLARPRFAAAAVVEHGGGGSAVAAPIVRDLLLYAQRNVRLAGLGGSGTGGRG